MIPILVAFSFGVIMGTLVVLGVAERKRRKYLREASEQMRHSSDIHVMHAATMNSVFRSVLEKIEAVDVDGARKTLSKTIANFHQIRTKRRNELATDGIVFGSDCVGQELQAIQRDAKRFQCLRDALSQKSDELVS